jgi:hypothetical protein
MTTNSECVVNVLRTHREARGWTDEAVCADLLAQLGLDPEGKAKNPAPVADPSRVTEDEVVAAEAAAKEAADKAKAARDALNAQTKADADAAHPAAPKPADASNQPERTAAQQRADDRANRSG